MKSISGKQMIDILNPNVIEAAAAAIVNERVMRRGSPAIINVLDIIPAKHRKEVMEEAAAALKAAAECKICSCGELLPELNACVEAKLDAGYPCPHAKEKRS